MDNIRIETNSLILRRFEENDMKAIYLLFKEQWQPKNFPVIFRMNQLNFDGQKNRIFQKYWNLFDEHFIEIDI